MNYGRFSTLKHTNYAESESEIEDRDRSVRQHQPAGLLNEKELPLGVTKEEIHHITMSGRITRVTTTRSTFLI